MNEFCLYEVGEGVATITLKRPDRLNATDKGLLDGALAAIEEASHDSEVQAVILTGAGRGFCVGDDPCARDTLGAGTPEWRTTNPRRYVRSSLLQREMPKLTIAAFGKRRPPEFEQLDLGE